MNVYITTGVSPLILSIENKAVIPMADVFPERTEWETTQTSPLVSGQHLVCTTEVYNAIKDKVGTLEAPALIASAAAEKHPGRQNCYVENGSLKLAA